jgi:hypothetical protein
LIEISLELKMRLKELEILPTSAKNLPTLAILSIPVMVYENYDLEY